MFFIAMMQYLKHLPKTEDELMTLDPEVGNRGPELKAIITETRLNLEKSKLIFSRIGELSSI